MWKYFLFQNGKFMGVNQTQECILCHCSTKPLTLLNIAQWYNEQRNKV